MSNSDDLEALFPLRRDITVAGVPVALGPLKVRQFGAFSKAPPICFTARASRASSRNGSPAGWILASRAS